MKWIYKCKLSFQYMTKYFRQYLFLGISICLGFTIITTLTSFTSGLKNGVIQSAKDHYGGDIFLTGFLHRDTSSELQIIGNNNLIRKMESSKNLSYIEHIKRTNYFKEGVLYFAGFSIRQKNILGVDWQKEIFDARTLTLQGVDIDNIILDDESIIISQPTADKLNARVGDNITVQVRTLTNQKNTGTFIVRGIFKDRSIFGYYKCYISRKSLNRLLHISEDSCSTIGLYYKTKRQSIKDLPNLYSLIKEQEPQTQLVLNKKQYSQILLSFWKDYQYMIVPLQVFIDQISELITALDLVSYFLYFMILVIILVSILITYKLIIMERTTEISTFRALGILRKDLLEVYLWEALLIFLAAIGIGLVLSVIVLGIISRLSFDWVPGIEIFLTDGRLHPVITFKSFLINIGILLFSILPAVYFPARKIVGMNISRNLNLK